MSSRPLCYRCNEYMCLSGCQCRKPAFSKEDVEKDDEKAVEVEMPDFYAGQDWF